MKEMIMNHLSKWAISCALILTTSTIAHSGDTMSEEQKAVLAAINTMTSSFEGADIPAVMSTYEPGAVVMFQPGEAVANEAQLEEMFSAMSGTKPKFSYSGHEVIVNNDIAIHISPWSMTATGPDGKPIVQDGLSVSVLRKQEDGQWKLVIDNPHGSRLLAGAE